MVGLLHQIQDIVTEEVPFTPVYTPPQVYAMRPNVKGSVLAPQRWADYTNAYKE